MGATKAPKTLFTIQLAGPKRLAITPRIKLATIIMMPMTSKSPKVFSQRPPTNLLLRDRLSNVPARSITIAGTTTENIIAKIIPGTIRQISPTTIKMPVTIPAPSNEGNRLTVKLRVSERPTLRFSRMSEASLTAMPPAIVSIIQLTRSVKANVATKNPKKEKRYEDKTSGGAVTDGGMGSGNIKLTISVHAPVRKPAIRKGKKNKKNLEE